MGLLPSACPHRTLIREKSLSSPIPVGEGAVDTNDWCIKGAVDTNDWCIK